MTIRARYYAGSWENGGHFIFIFAFIAAAESAGAHEAPALRRVAPPIVIPPPPLFVEVDLVRSGFSGRFRDIASFGSV